MCLFGTLSTIHPKEGIAVSILGAPASGKGFMQNKIIKRIKDFQKIAPALKEKNGEREDLTIDEIRKEIQNLPGLVQLNLVINTFYWLKELKTAYPKLYILWWNQFIKR